MPDAPWPGPLPMTVADWMRAALYDEARGYYAKGPRIGAAGDFYTASHASLFPPALARFLDAALQRLPGARVLELGGGVGEVAASLGHPTTVVEPSPGLADAQRARGLDVVPSLEALPPAPSVVLANEVLDALPVHRLVKEDGEVRELYVTLHEGRLVERPGPRSTPRLDAPARRLAPLLPEGAKAEVCLAADDLLAHLARAAPASLVLFLDYGGAPETLYGEARPDGTLRGFHQHRVTGPFERPGEQDVTADVDWPFVAERAAAHGFTVAGESSQGAFLGDLGLVDDMMDALARGDHAAYLAAKGLLLPGGMGERFRALLLARGVDATALPGFRGRP